MGASIGTRLAIVADDLTGALDSAAPLAGLPGGAVVATDPSGLEDALATGAAVVSVSTRSREIPADEARSRVAAVLGRLPPGIRIMKKVDSRLKGNIAAELSALGDRPLLVAPAIPEFGRIVRGGKVSGFGIAVPIDIAAVLGAAAARALIPVVDNQQAMRAAVAAAPEGAVLVGARGLAQALADIAGARAAAVVPLSRPVWFAVGSTDPITLDQIATLRARCPDLVAIGAPAGDVPDGARHGAVTLVQITTGAPVPPDEAARRFARGVAPHLRHAACMVLSGGATAEAMLDALGIGLLRIEGEILPGLPVSRAGAQRIVTKSGGFGGPDALALLLAGQPEGIS